MSDGISWQAVSAIAAAFGLLVSGFSALRAAKTQRLTNLTTVRGRIHDLYWKLGDIQSMPVAKQEEREAFQMKQRLWDETFFNELEWVSALYLEGEVPEELMLSHLGPALVRYYEEIYLGNSRLHPSAADPGLYRCFRTVVGMFRSRIPAARTPSTSVSARRVPAPIYSRTGRVDLLA